MKNFSKILLAQVAQVAQTFFENATKADFVTPKVSLKALLLLRCATNATNANQ